jgi:hypothetical protein
VKEERLTAPKKCSAADFPLQMIHLPLQWKSAAAFSAFALANVGEQRKVNG